MPLKLPFQKGGSQRHAKLDQTDVQLLKELASFFLSVNFHGSQLEALLLARASQASPLDADGITPSILTPSPVLDPSSASESEAAVGVETRPVLFQVGTTNPISQPDTSLLPSAVDAEVVSNVTRSPSNESPPTTSNFDTRPNGSGTATITDKSFQNATFGRENDSSGRVKVTNFSYNDPTASHVASSSFSGTQISGSADITNHSFNGNKGSFNTTTTTTTII